MAGIQKFEDLRIWNDARTLVKKIYALKKPILAQREYDLYDQMARCSRSVMSNIAEGFEKDGTKEFARYLYIAKGSAGELRSQLYECVDKGFLPENTELISESQVLARRINNFILAIKSTGHPGRRYENPPR